MDAETRRPAPGRTVGRPAGPTAPGANPVFLTLTSNPFTGHETADYPTVGDAVGAARRVLSDPDRGGECKAWVIDMATGETVWRGGSFA
jgi:hypothetical protein